MFASDAIAQSKPKPATAEVLKPASKTYSGTLNTIKAWLKTDDRAQLGHLFLMGDGRTADLVAACHNADDRISRAAFLILQLLGNSDASTCMDFLRRKHISLLLTRTENLSDTDFISIEGWYANRATKNGYDCGEDYDPLTLLDDTIIYTLILDGSPRSRSVLDRMLAFEKVCKRSTLMIEEDLERADSLLVSAKAIGHNIEFERKSDSVKNAVRASAFFLPAQYRGRSEVNIIAYNQKGDRLLLEISYVCGQLCGRGYYVVLRNDGSAWQYAVIRMAWIS